MPRFFSPGKEEDESGLTPGEDDDAAGRKKDRKDWTVIRFVDDIDPAYFLRSCRAFHIVAQIAAKTILNTAMPSGALAPVSGLSPRGLSALITGGGLPVVVRSGTKTGGVSVTGVDGGSVTAGWG